MSFDCFCYCPLHSLSSPLGTAVRLTVQPKGYPPCLRSVSCFTALWPFILHSGRAPDSQLSNAAHLLNGFVLQAPFTLPVLCSAPPSRFSSRHSMLLTLLHLSEELVLTPAPPPLSLPFCRTWFSVWRLLDLTMVLFLKRLLIVCLVFCRWGFRWKIFGRWTRFLYSNNTSIYLEANSGLDPGSSSFHGRAG